MCMCPTEDTESAHLSLVVLARTPSSEGSSRMVQAAQWAPSGHLMIRTHSTASSLNCRQRRGSRTSPLAPCTDWAPSSLMSLLCLPRLQNEHSGRTVPSVCLCPPPPSRPRLNRPAVPGAQPPTDQVRSQYLHVSPAIQKPAPRAALWNPAPR